MTEQRDPLWPNGDRPMCHFCGKKRVYMGGRCGDCFAAEGARQREAYMQTIQDAHDRAAAERKAPR